MLPYPLLPLLYTSLACSTLAVVLALCALSTHNLSSFFWSLPVAFAVTFPYQLAVLVQAHFAPFGSNRVFRLRFVIWSFTSAVLWSVAAGTSVAFTVLLVLHQVQAHELKAIQLALTIASSTVALLECVPIWWMAFVSNRERKKIRYAAKWRPITSNPSQQWSFGRDTR